MRGFIGVALAAAMLSGCAAMSDQDRIAAVSAGAGAAVGALAGATSGPEGAAIGAAAGGVAGATIGYFVRPEGCSFRNKRGEVWRVPCRDQRVMAEACFTSRGPFGDRQEAACPRVPLPR